MLELDRRSRSQYFTMWPGYFCTN